MQQKLELLKDVCDNQMPFHRLLDVRVDSLNVEEIRVRIEMREALIGNYMRKILHVNVISSVLELTGPLIAFVELCNAHNVRIAAGSGTYLVG